MDLLAAAFDTLPVQERIALEMIHVEGYDDAEAADFLDVDKRAVARLVGRARRRLRRAYTQLGGGGVVGVFALFPVAGHLRRRCAALGRLAADSTEAVAHWAILNPAPALVAATTAAGVSIAVAVVAVVGPGDPRRDMGVRPLSVATAEGAPSPSPSTAAGGSSLEPPGPPTPHDRGSLAVRQSVRQHPAGTSQSWHAEATAPAPPPPPGPPPDYDPDTIEFFTLYDCPPPEQRLVVESLACPLVAP